MTKHQKTNKEGHNGQKTVWLSDEQHTQVMIFAKHQQLKLVEALKILVSFGLRHVPSWVLTPSRPATHTEKLTGDEHGPS